jgi:hypothetical protein
MAGSPKTVRSLDCNVYVNGTLFGVASARWSISTNRKAIWVIDSQLPVELAATRSLVSGNIDVFKQHNDAGLEGVGITPIQDQLSNERYFFLQIVDALSGTMLLQIPKCAVGNQSWSVEARGVLHGTFDFQGISYTSEF